MKIPRFIPALTLLAIAPATFAEVDFEKQILPLIEKSCVECHKAPYEEDGRVKKPKGGLRMDAAWAMEAGGEGGALYVAGDPKTSEMIFRVTLPEDDDDFMPPKGEKWNDAEIKLVSAWIQEGAKFGDWKGNLEGKPKETEKVAEVYVSKVQQHYEKLSDGLKPAPDDAIAKVTELGANVVPLATGNPLLDVNFIANRMDTKDENLATIGAIRDNLAHLDLSETAITDEALKGVGDLPRLTRLDLNNTGITDAGLKHLAGLENLTYLNLYGTKVTDAGVKDLAKIKSLQNVYLWQTEVTDKGAKQLQNQLPEAKVNWK